MKTSKIAPHEFDDKETSSPKRLLKAQSIDQKDQSSPGNASE